MKRITITGRVGLNLISTRTKTKSISEEGLKSIGKLLMYVIDHCIPKTTFPDIFNHMNKQERKYIEEFGKQLLITKEMGIDRFNIPALSIVVNRDLKPHYDSMNPVDMIDDYTFSLNIEIPTENIPVEMKEIVKRQYPFSVPLCIVLYPWKLLIYYARRMTEIDDYIARLPNNFNGRNKLVALLRDVGKDTDYIGNFFSSSNRENIQVLFKADPKSIFKGRKAVLSEAVDKMVSILYYVLL